jgi:diketogulonate reductase-like aldo/keto reductase
MLMRAIPGTGEEIPAMGLGTWQGFDIGGNAADRQSRAEVLRELFAAGGRVIDSSPMYGRAEETVGDLLARVAPEIRPFLATKVYISGDAAGRRQIEQSFRLMRTDVMDLFQIHNLVDWRTHLGTLRRLKEEGRVRYIGITHYTSAALDDLAAIIRAEDIDFVQLAFSIAVPDAAETVLPLCADRGVAVLVNRPFDAGGLFHDARARDLPPWSGELGIASWGQYFLKFILAHQAVTCVIPGTGNPGRAADDFAAGNGHIPDAAEARKMLDFWHGI